MTLAAGPVTIIAITHGNRSRSSYYYIYPPPRAHSLKFLSARFSSCFSCVRFEYSPNILSFFPFYKNKTTSLTPFYSIVTLTTSSSFCVALSSVRRAVLSGAMLWQKWSVLGVAMASLLPSCLLLVEQISRRKKRFRLGGNVSVKMRDRGNYFFGRGGDLRQLKLCLVIKLNYRLARSVVTKRCANERGTREEERERAFRKN